MPGYATAFHFTFLCSSQAAKAAMASFIAADGLPLALVDICCNNKLIVMTHYGIVQQTTVK